MLLAFLLTAWVNFGSVVSIDHTVHDWGEVSLSDGPLSCSFEVKNISSKPLSITSVVSSCGCTDVKWTRESIAPKKSGTISAVYKNEDGAFPFDKTLTVYFDAVEKPLILHLKGVVHKGLVVLEDVYSVRFGAVGTTDREFKVGNMSQGEMRSAQIRFAGFGTTRARVELRSLSPELSFAESTFYVNPQEVTPVAYTVKSSRSLWGKNWYDAEVWVDGRNEGKISLWAITKEDFSGLSREEKKKGPRIDLEDNTFSFNPQKPGKAVRATFHYKTSAGFEIYKIDVDNPAAKVVSRAADSLVLEVDTSEMKKGEQLIMVSLYTNSPQRPVVNLFIAGMIR